MEKISSEDIAGDAESGEIKTLTAREHVMAFVKIEDNSTYTFKVDTVIYQPENFIHNMRVVLSKLRGIVRRKGMVVKPFKMIHVSSERIDDRWVEVTLRKELDSFVKEMNDTLDDLTMGSKDNGKEITPGTSR